MFLVSAALVGVAIVLLVVGIITATLMLVYFAIGVSVVSMILLGLGIFLQRELLWGKQRRRSSDAGGTSDSELEPVEAASAAAGTGPAPAHPGAEYPPDDAGYVLPGDELPGDEFVRVVPGRRRYHRPGCASLAGRASEELTVGEAREEGFSACTVCFPADAAGAPAAAGDPAHPEPAVADPAASEAAGVAAEELVTPAHGIPVVQAAAQASGPGEARAADARATEARATEARPAKAPQASARGGRAGPGQPGTAPGSSGETVWVVRGVSRYHHSDCVLIRSVDDDDVDTMTQADAAATGCTPCRACHIVDEPLAR